MAEVRNPEDFLPRTVGKCRPGDGVINTGHTVEFARWRNSAAHLAAGVRCVECHSTWPMSRVRLNAAYVEIGELPFYESRYGPESCERCGIQGAELHHWAPQALFSDADKWPTSFLCVGCHREWHDRVQGARKVAAGC